MSLAIARIVNDGPSSWSSRDLGRTYLRGRDYAIESQRELDALGNESCFQIVRTVPAATEPTPEPTVADTPAPMPLRRPGRPGKRKP